MITARRNQYRGVNAHLNSLLQAKGSRLRWDEFHGYYIRQMAHDFNDAILPLGYEAVVEESLQIRTGEGLGEARPRNPEADVTVSDQQEPPRPQSGAALIVEGTATLTIPLHEYLSEVAPYAAVAIRRPGQANPYAWIELLSPANKPGGGHNLEYQRRRQRLLEAVPHIYIEVDLLHKSGPVYAGIPSYKRGDEGSFAYSVAAYDVRTDVWEAEVTVSFAGVDEPLPTLTIPLSGDDRLTADFQRSYDNIYEREFWGIRPNKEIDYSQPVTDPESYSPADRQRIEARRQAVIAAHQRGVDLDALEQPLPVSSDEQRGSGAPTC